MDGGLTRTRQPSTVLGRSRASPCFTSFRPFGWLALARGAVRKASGRKGVTQSSTACGASNKRA